MKNLSEYIKEEGEGIAPSLGAEQSASTFMTPGKTMGVGNPKPPTVEEPGSGDLFGETIKETPKTKKEKKNTSKTKKEKQ